MAAHEYDRWVTNYISVQQGLAEGRFTSEEADWSKTAFYIKEAGSTDLTPVSMKIRERNGLHEVSWIYWSYWDDGEDVYLVDDAPLAFSYDPYEGLTRFTLTIVPRASGDDPIPESWNGTLFFEEGCPLRGFDVLRNVWEWVDAHTLDVNVSGDLLVTPYGEDHGVPNPIATREIAVRQTR
ncbi:hypothetical protein [Streptosporangium canum]|nr:hypothetical protein [Streptosporangium canum]